MQASIQSPAFAPIFFHEVPLQIDLRGRFQTIHFAAGFSKAIDLLSGMTVNLTSVQCWLTELSIEILSKQFSDPIQFLSWSQARLQNDASGAGAELIQVQIRFFDQTRFQHNGGQFYFQKSENCVLGESTMSFKNIKTLQILFRISDLFAFDRALAFVIPKQLVLQRQKLLAELQLQAGIPIEQIEVFDAIGKFSEVLLPQS